MLKEVIVEAPWSEMTMRTDLSPFSCVDNDMFSGSVQDPFNRYPINKINHTD